MRQVSLERVYALSDDIVIRGLAGEQVLVPVSGMLDQSQRVCIHSTILDRPS